MTSPALLSGPEGHPRPAVSTEAPRGTPMTREQFATECNLHLDQVWRQLRAMGVAQRYLEDATQEVFLVAHRKVDGFEGRARLGTWLYAIAYRVGCNYRRKAKRDAQTEPFDSQYEGTERTPEQVLLNKQAAELVQNFCDTLSEKLRDVFVLCLLEEQPAGEVAELLGVPENTVYSRVRLVRDAFKKELARHREPAP